MVRDPDTEKTRNKPDEYLCKLAVVIVRKLVGEYVDNDAHHNKANESPDHRTSGPRMIFDAFQ